MAAPRWITIKGSRESSASCIYCAGSVAGQVCHEAWQGSCKDYIACDKCKPKLTREGGWPVPYGAALDMADFSREGY